MQIFASLFVPLVPLVSWWLGISLVFGGTAAFDDGAEDRAVDEMGERT